MRCGRTRNSGRGSHDSDEFNNKSFAEEESSLTLATDNAPKAMVEAAEKGDMAVVRKQLKAGVAVDAKGQFEETALIKAAQGNQTKMSIPGDEGCGRTRRSGYTAMMMAAHHGNEELVRYLHENGARVNAQDARAAQTGRPPRPNS